MKKFIIVLAFLMSLSTYATYYSPFPETATTLDSQILKSGDVVFDSTNKILRLGNGTTMGGLLIPAGTGAITADAPLAGNGTSGSHLSIPAASSSIDGYLTSANWTTFNGKLDTNGSAANLTSFPILNQDTTGTSDTALYANAAGNANTVTNGVYTGDAGTVFLAPNGSSTSLQNVCYSTDTSLTVDTGATSAGYVNVTINGNSYKVMIATPSGM